jgi:hypothetical protein
MKKIQMTTFILSMILLCVGCGQKRKTDQTVIVKKDPGPCSCTFLPGESIPDLDKFTFSCVRTPWKPIKVKTCGMQTQDAAEHFAEDEVNGLNSPPADFVLNYCQH